MLIVKIWFTKMTFLSEDEKIYLDSCIIRRRKRINCSADAKSNIYILWEWIYDDEVCVSLQEQSLSMFLEHSNSCTHYDQLVTEYLSYKTEKPAIVSQISRFRNYFIWKDLSETFKVLSELLVSWHRCPSSAAALERNQKTSADILTNRVVDWGK